MASASAGPRDAAQPADTSDTSDAGPAEDGAAGATDGSAGTAPGDQKAARARTLACCAALEAEAKRKHRKDQRFEITASICRQIAERVGDGRSSESAAKTLIRAQILGLKVPEGC